MLLRRYDLNLLPILSALLRHRSVTKAGREVGLTQSSMSHALLRLREVFGDPLLVASGRQMLLTRRAELILERLQASIISIEQLFALESFDPSKVERRFRISTSDYVAFLILPHLIRRLRAIAPKLTLQLSWDDSDVPVKLKTGALDLSLLPRTMLGGHELRSETLYSDDLVVIAAINHPRIRELHTLDAFIAAPHAYFRRDNAPGIGFAESQLQKNGISLEDALIVPDFLTLTFLIAETDYISLIHRKFAEKIRPLLGIRMIEPPFQTERFQLDAWWSVTSESDAGHQWFRAQVRDCVRDAFGEKAHGKSRPRSAPQ